MEGLTFVVTSHNLTVAYPHPGQVITVCSSLHEAESIVIEQCSNILKAKVPINNWFEIQEWLYGEYQKTYKYHVTLWGNK